jgi:hypothetical protein
MAGALLLYCTHGKTIEQNKEKEKEEKEGWGLHTTSLF